LPKRTHPWELCYTIKAEGEKIKTGLSGPWKGKQFKHSRIGPRYTSGWQPGGNVGRNTNYGASRQAVEVAYRPIVPGGLEQRCRYRLIY